MAMTAEVWQQMHDGLRAFVSKRLMNEAEVDDVLQEVFMRMHRGIDRLEDPRRVLPWVYQIARHAIIDHYRKGVHRKERPSGLAGEMEATGLALSATAFGRAEDQREQHAELSGCLRPMIDRLPKDYREAVVLVEIEGLTQLAAATRLGLSLSGMKSRVQRGRKQLKQMLEDCCLIQFDRRGGVIDFETREDACDPCANRPRR